jgi:hypothetical protein
MSERILCHGQLMKGSKHVGWCQRSAHYFYKDDSVLSMTTGLMETFYAARCTLHRFENDGKIGPWKPVSRKIYLVAQVHES